MKPFHHGRPFARAKVFESFIFFVSLFLLTIMLLNAFRGIVLLQYAIIGLGKADSVPPALNPQLTNTIPDDGGPVLYYNGSGDVPP